MEMKVNKQIQNKYLKYKSREETECLCIVFNDTQKTLREIYRDQRNKGMFDMGVHGVLMPDGTLYEGVPLTAHADGLYAHSKDGIYVMIIGCADMEVMTSLQDHTFKKLKEDLQLTTIYME